MTGEMRLSMTGLAKMDWSSGYYELDDASVGYKADFSRDPGPFHEAPIATNYPSYSYTSETVILPPKFGDVVFDDDANVDQTVAGVQYRRQLSHKDGRVTMTNSQRAITPEFPYADAVSAQETLRALANARVFIKKPQNYLATAEERALRILGTPTTAKGFIDRGIAYAEQEKWDNAIADFTSAIALSPNDDSSLLIRARTYLMKGDMAAAQRDMDAAAQINPKSEQLLGTRIAFAQKSGDKNAVIAVFEDFLKVVPNNAHVLAAAARAYRVQARNAEAIALMNRAIEAKPDDPDLYLLRANIYAAMDDRAKLIEQAELVIAAAPEDPYAYAVAGGIYARAGRADDAIVAYNKGIAIEPADFLYVERALKRPKSDLAGREADLAAAYKIDSTRPETLFAQADLYLDQGNKQAAIAKLTQMMDLEDANRPNLLVRRGIVFEKFGEKAMAAADFEAARKLMTTADALNSACWEKALKGVALQSALADCDMALAKEPGSVAILDSRGLALLRLGRLDDAIAAYDQALAKSPRLPTSLYGRGIARGRKGDKEGAAADIAAAIAVQPDITSELSDIGDVPQDRSASATPIKP